jgi:lysophospholipase L1-like esterase
VPATVAATQRAAAARAATVRTAPLVSVVGDSVAGTLLVPSARPWFSGVARLDVHTWRCRRTTAPNPSCNGALVSTLAELRLLHGQLSNVVVIVSGYNDAGDVPSQFGRRIDAVMSELTAGAPGRIVIWPTLANGTGWYGAENQALRAATSRWHNLVVPDWETASAGRAGWFVDGIHPDQAGAQAFGWLVADTLKRLLPSGAATTPGRSFPITAKAPSTPKPSTPKPSTPKTSAPKLNSPKSTTTKSATTALRLGARGSAVRTLQRQLAAQGFSPGPIDGYYGARTAAAVARQRAAASALAARTPAHGSRAR